MFARMKVVYVCILMAMHIVHASRFDLKEVAIAIEKSGGINSGKRSKPSQKTNESVQSQTAPPQFRVSLMLSKDFLNQLLRHEIGFIIRYFGFPEGVIKLVHGFVDQERSELRAVSPKVVRSGPKSMVNLQVTHVDCQFKNVEFRDATLSMNIETWPVEGEPRFKGQDGFLANLESIDSRFPHLEINTIRLAEAEAPRPVAEAEAPRPEPESKGAKLKAFAQAAVSPTAWLNGGKKLVAAVAGTAALIYKELDIIPSFGCVRLLGTIYNFRVMTITADEAGNLGFGLQFMRHDIEDPEWAWNENDQKEAMPFPVLRGERSSKIAVYMDRPLYDRLAEGAYGVMSDAMTWVTTSAFSKGVAASGIAKAIAAHFINLILWMTDISPKARIQSVESIIKEVGRGMSWEIDVSKHDGSWFAELMGYDGLYSTERFESPCPGTIQHCQPNRCNNAKTKCGACEPGYELQKAFTCKPFECVMGKGAKCKTCPLAQKERKVHSHCSTCNPGYSHVVGRLPPYVTDCRGDHIVGEEGTNGCSVYLSPEECRKAAELEGGGRFLGMANGPMHPYFPRGCFRNSGNYFFNNHEPGAAHASSTPICKELLNKFRRGHVVDPKATVFAGGEAASYLEDLWKKKYNASSSS